MWAILKSNPREQIKRPKYPSLRMYIRNSIITKGRPKKYLNYVPISHAIQGLVCELIFCSSPKIPNINVNTVPFRHKKNKDIAREFAIHSVTASLQSRCRGVEISRHRDLSNNRSEIAVTCFDRHGVVGVGFHVEFASDPNFPGHEINVRAAEPQKIIPVAIHGVSVLIFDCLVVECSGDYLNDQ